MSYNSMSLNHEILGSEMAENKLEGFSIIQVEDVVNELHDDPDFNHEAYNSILNAELEILPNQMGQVCREDCRMNGMQDGKPCCEVDCSLFKKAVQFHERFDSSYDICFNCPEKNRGCLGYDYCMWRNTDDDNLQVKDVKLLADALLWNSIIDEVEFDALVAKGVRFISYKDYQIVADVVSVRVLSTIQDMFLKLVGSKFSAYLPEFVNEVSSKPRKANKSVEFEIQYEKYMEQKNNTMVDKVLEDNQSQVLIYVKKGKVSKSYIGIVKFEDKEIKFFIKGGGYLVSEKKLPTSILTLIEKRIQNSQNKMFKLPKMIKHKG